LPVIFGRKPIKLLNCYEQREKETSIDLQPFVLTLQLA